jgi:GNAT superfamily N-acetyltransferase
MKLSIGFTSPVCYFYGMNNYRIVLMDTSDSIERAMISKGIGEYNESKVGPSNSKPLVLAFKSEQDEVVAGLVGKTSHGWLFVELLWVHENARGEKLGSQLLINSESEAKKRNCHSAHLDTFSFQALPFYEKHGYQKFGELNDFPLGHKRFFLKKSL